MLAILIYLGGWNGKVFNGYLDPLIAFVNQHDGDIF